MGQEKYLSVIIPLYNEEENIRLLHTSVGRVLQTLDQSYEIIYVDDGSTDATFPLLTQLASIDRHVQVVQLSRNFGQTAAITAGIAQSSGCILVFMDGDLQNDPHDIPRLLTKVAEGYDIVSGWRRHRQDAQLSRILPSLLANRLISRITGVHLHDYGCTLKAYRREIFDYVQLYGEMHRFIPAYAALAGATIAEIEVAHHPRRFGVSKYGLSRTVRVILDLLTLKFLASFGTKPIYAFGIPGLLSFLLGNVLMICVLGRKIFPPHVRVHRNPLLPVSISFSGFGFVCVMMGLLAEMLMRTYHEAQDKLTYVVKSVVTFPEGNAGEDSSQPGILFGNTVTRSTTVQESQVEQEC